jgi:hypothetical protein
MLVLAGLAPPVRLSIISYQSIRGATTPRRPARKIRGPVPAREGPMIRTLLALLLVAMLALPLAAKPASQGVTVEIGDFEYTYYLSADDWSMTCQFRVDGSEWRTATSSGQGAERTLHIPGTTVRVGDPGDRTLLWNYGEDVRELRFERQ